MTIRDLMRLAGAFAATTAAIASTIVQFSPSTPEIGPFPSNALTVVDASQKTGRRIQMPLPDCAKEVTLCNELKRLNTLDGFSIFPRLRIRFSGPINPDTIREGVFLITLDNLTNEEYGLGRAGTIISINHVIYDPDTNTAYAKPDEVLDQHRKYALLVTNALRDAGGAAVEAEGGFQTCIESPADDYCGELSAVVRPLNELLRRLAGTRSIVAASVFTTLSATSWMEKARDLLPSYSTASAAAAAKSVFAIPDLQSIVLQRQTRISPSPLEEFQVALTNLEGIGRIAFRTYKSPNFYGEDTLIPTIPTAFPLAAPVATNEIPFHVLLPQSTKPLNGYPVVITAHGSGDSRFGMSLAIAGTMASRGYATIGLNAVGHGYGPSGKVVVTEKNGAVIEMALGGRGTDYNRDGVIGSPEGCGTTQDVRSRDCIRQTAIDIMQLVRVIRAGVDLDGDGINDLDGSQVHLAGFSFGSWVGTLVAATDPFLSATVLTAPSATYMDSVRWSAVNRPAFIASLGQRIPPVPPNKGADYDDNSTFRDQPVKINQVPGAIEIQNILENWEWTEMPGDPIAYAPHLRLSTLPGVPLKRVLFQIATSDRSLQTPQNSAVVRAAGMTEWASLYRHDLARTKAPDLLPDAHRRIIGWWNPASTSGPTFAAAPAPMITLAVQRQAADFLGTGARCGIGEPCIPDVNDLVLPYFGFRLFETPLQLPDGPDYIVP